MSNYGEVNILHLSDDQIKFELNNIDISMANSLRRIFTAEIGTLAFDKIMILDNSSVLSDNMIAQRIGLIPLKLINDKIPEEEFILKQFCTCDSYCNKCSIEFTLDVTNTSDDVMIVYSNSLISKDERCAIVNYTSKEEEKKDKIGKGISIVKLAKNQRIKCIIYATLGFGQLHAKWIPAISKYSREPIINLNTQRLNELSHEDKENFINSCPRKVYDIEDEHVIIKNKNSCMFCDECVKFGSMLRKHYNDDNIVSILEVPNKVIFDIEAIGQLSPILIITLGIKKLQQKLLNIKNETTEILKKEIPNVIDTSFNDSLKKYTYIDSGGFI